MQLAAPGCPTREVLTRLGAGGRPVPRVRGLADRARGVGHRRGSRGWPGRSPRATSCSRAIVEWWVHGEDMRARATASDPCRSTGRCSSRTTSGSGCSRGRSAQAGLAFPGKSRAGRPRGRAAARGTGDSRRGRRRPRTRSPTPSSTAAPCSSRSSRRDGCRPRSSLDDGNLVRRRGHGLARRSCATSAATPEHVHRLRRTSARAGRSPRAFPTVLPGDTVLRMRSAEPRRRRRPHAGLRDARAGAAEELYARFASRIYGLGIVMLGERRGGAGPGAGHVREALAQRRPLRHRRAGSSRRGCCSSRGSLAIDTLRRRVLESRIAGGDRPAAGGRRRAGSRRARRHGRPRRRARAGRWRASRASSGRRWSSRTSAARPAPRWPSSRASRSARRRRGSARR